jgi:hypothetical protein
MAAEGVAVVTNPHTPTRRSVLTGAGAAVAAGVAGAVAVPAAAAATGAVAVGPDDLTVAEFRGRIAQTGDSGQHFTATGFLTKLRGATHADLFAGHPPAVGTALFTLHATGRLSNRVLDMSVHALDITGQLTVYQRVRPGADFADPASFQKGRAVATFGLVLQDVLAVFAPASGIPTLTGDMRQTAATALRAGLAGKQFGALNQRLRLFATGLGQLTDPVTLNANLEIAGNWTAS